MCRSLPSDRRCAKSLQELRRCHRAFNSLSELGPDLGDQAYVRDQPQMARRKQAHSVSESVTIPPPLVFTQSHHNALREIEEHAQFQSRHPTTAAYHSHNERLPSVCVSPSVSHLPAECIPSGRSRSIGYCICGRRLHRLHRESDKMGD